MSEQPDERDWTIESICAALSNPTLAQRCVGEINKAPKDKLLDVFAKWERLAAQTQATVERGRELASYDELGEQVPGNWTPDRTAAILDRAAEIRLKRHVA
jgi:hypothetical protein